MRCHNSNGWAACLWAEGMISGSINWEHVCSLHVHEHASVCVLLMAVYFSSPTFGDRSIFTFCWFLFFFLLSSETALSYTSVWAEAVFASWVKQEHGTMAFSPSIKPGLASLRALWKRGFPSSVWINTFARQKEQIKANEVVQRDRTQCQRDLVWGLETFSWLSFLILGGFFSWRMLGLGKMWGGNTETLLITQKAEGKVIYSYWTVWHF